MFTRAPAPQWVGVGMVPAHRARVCDAPAPIVCRLVAAGGRAPGGTAAATATLVAVAAAAGQEQDRHEQSERKPSHVKEYEGPPAPDSAYPGLRSTLTIPSSTRTGKVSTGNTAGSVSGRPLRMSMFAPCRGQTAYPSSASKSPSHSGPSSWEQRSSIA